MKDRKQGSPVIRALGAKGYVRCIFLPARLNRLFESCHLDGGGGKALPLVGISG